MNYTKIIFSPEELSVICRYIIKENYPSTIILQGDLGAGKTTFVRMFMRELLYQGIVSSPTFTLMNVYQTDSITAHHFDLYRLSGESEAVEWGFDEAVVECDYSFIEWPERAWNLIPQPYTLVNIQHGVSENQRIISIQK